MPDLADRIADALEATNPTRLVMLLLGEREREIIRSTIAGEAAGSRADLTILLHFEQSETCADAHGLVAGDRVTIPYDTTDGSWVQVTFESIRTQDGRVIAEIGKDCGCWSLEDREGCFSDVVIEYVDERESQRKANFERLQAAGYNPHKLSAVEYETALELLDEQEGVTN